MYELDDTDCRIIDLLMEDGRLNAAEIARRLKGQSSERSIRYRIHRMQEAGIFKISAVVSPRALGYQVVADVTIEVEVGQIHEVAGTLAAHEMVSYLGYAIGEGDISAQIVAHDNAEVYRLTTEFIGRLPGVRRTTISIIPVNIKDSTQWRVPRAK